MKRILTSSILLTAFAMVPAAAPRADQLRTVYFSAIDSKGAPVTDLTAADLAVKEGGKSYPIAAVKPATDPMQVFIVVDDVGSGAFQGGVAQLLQVLLGHGEFAISVLNPQPLKAVDFTGEFEPLKAALPRMGPRGKVQSDGEQIIEAVAEAAKELQTRKARRAIVVLTAGGEKAQSDQAEAAMTALKNCGASLNVLYITGLDLGKLLGDGPKQSGGLVQQVSGTSISSSDAFTKIGNNLLHQYVLTYNIPDGVKLNEKLALTSTRKGVTLLAPGRIPDK